MHGFFTFGVFKCRGKLKLFPIFITGVVDTSGIFTTGVVDTEDKFTKGVIDTGENLSSVSITRVRIPVYDLSPVSTTTEINL